MERTLTSHGVAFDTSPERFGELRDANALLGSPEALRARMQEEGYLLLRGYLDRDVVLGARKEILTRLASVGEIDSRYPLDEAVATGQATWSADFVRGLWQSAPVKAMCHQGRMIAFFEQFLGEAVRPLDYIWVRRVGPGGATGCHYDVVYMGRGTLHLFTAWTPVGEVPFALGPLAILEGSHRLEELKATYGKLDVDRDRDNNPYGGGWLSKDPARVQAQFGGRWLTTEFQAGDVLIFTMFTLHCSLDNTSNRVRLSTDSRYQRASEPVDERWAGEDPLAQGRSR